MMVDTDKASICSQLSASSPPISFPIDCFWKRSVSSKVVRPPIQNHVVGRPLRLLCILIALRLSRPFRVFWLVFKNRSASFYGPEIFSRPQSYRPSFSMRNNSHSLDADFADACLRSPKTKDGSTMSPLPPSATNQYLPGGTKYKDSLAGIRQDNPRSGISVAQYLREWEQKWDRITGQGKPEGQHKKYEKRRAVTDK